jgi:hypothetical protein
MRGMGNGQWAMGNGHWALGKNYSSPLLLCSSAPLAPPAPPAPPSLFTLPQWRRRRQTIETKIHLQR